MFSNPLSSWQALVALLTLLALTYVDIDDDNESTDTPSVGGHKTARQDSKTTVETNDEEQQQAKEATPEPKRK